MRSIIVYLFLFIAFGQANHLPINYNHDIDYINQIQSEWNEYVRSLPRATEEDANLKFPELVSKYKYPVESHYVTTKDGYILNLHRIPSGLSGATPKNKIVYLQHGILSSSIDWIISGPEKGFGYLLADKGYDVWFGNARGNRYSKNHTELATDSKEFWNFSWHEIGTIDLPAMIDYILAHTEEQQLFYIGHSQGTTAFYVMCAELPEYNDKIRAQFSLAPIAYMKHMTSPLFKIIALAESGLEVLFDLIGMYEFMPTDGFLHTVSKEFCKDGLMQILCTNALFVACGFNNHQMNITLLPIMMGHTPAGAATKQLIHYGQEINSGKFRQFDYGFIENNKRYGQLSPPDYDLSKITAPVYLHYSRNDWLSDEADVLKLYNELGNCRGKFINSDAAFNHLDYIFGIDAEKYVYSKVIGLMARH